VKLCLSLIKWWVANYIYLYVFKILLQWTLVVRLFRSVCVFPLLHSHGLDTLLFLLNFLPGRPTGNCFSHSFVTWFPAFAAFLCLLWWTLTPFTPPLSAQMSAWAARLSSTARGSPKEVQGNPQVRVFSCWAFISSVDCISIIFWTANLFEQHFYGQHIPVRFKDLPDGDYCHISNSALGCASLVLPTGLLRPSFRSLWIT